LVLPQFPSLVKEGRGVVGPSAIPLLG
jgi:hypothetical protein